eukprot:Seg873.12 transcript_id=Seg873.12/GoldUCD/mRNA.D3Y31 product="hypothetical protein" protein_id=Seg873.12/GoldUCD/D3Y31
MGWQNNGNEYWVYTTNTRGNNSIKITGTFSITPVIGIASSNRLIVGKDHNINAVSASDYLFEIYVGGDYIDTLVKVPTKKGVEWKIIRVPNVNSGKAFDFTVTVTQSEGNDGTYNHSVKSELRGYNSTTTSTKDNVKWDFDNMKLFFGGNYIPDLFEGSYFHGCFSNILVQGVDVIATYFSQYPNNTNPVRGSRFGSPPYATAMQNCSDVTTVASTLGPTSSIAKITPTKKPGAAASNKASVFILMAAVFLTSPFCNFEHLTSFA